MFSLKKTLRRNLLITVTFVMVVLFSILYLGIQQLTKDFIVSRLQHDADSVIAALSKTQNDVWQIPSDKISTVYNRVHSGHYYQVLISNQTIRSRSLFDIEITIPKQDFDRSQSYFMVVSENEHWLAWVENINKKGEIITIWVAEDISSLESNLQYFILFAVGSVMLSILILLVTQYHILQRGFSPLEKVREAIRCRRLGIDNVSFQKLPVEILPLVEEIDRLLSQLSKRVQRTRNALGNLAHELKRPLQHYQSQIELIEPKQREIMQAILQSINEVVERELKRAKIVGLSAPGRFASVDDDMPHLIKALNSIYPEKVIRADYENGLVLPFDRDDILELFGNLLDNACKFSKRNIRINVEKVDVGWQITVEDDGDGISEDKLGEIAIRGVRLDEEIVGHGLGLSICKEIVESYAGKIHFQNSSGGGLVVKLFLPIQE